MKRFLLVLGIFLCLQGCAFARNLYDAGKGYYIDIDSFKRDGDYGYIETEEHSPEFDSVTIISLLELDLINHKVRIIKVGARDIEGKLIWVLEEFELSEELQEFRDIQKDSPIDKAFKIIKKMNETIPN